MSGAVHPSLASNLSTNLPIAIVGSLYLAGACGLAARLFTSLNPLTGAIYGATFALSGSLFDYGCEKAGIRQNNVAIVAARFFTNVAIGALVTTAVGFPITFKAALILPIITTGMLIGGAICTIALVFTVVIASRMIQDRCSIKEACQSLVRDGVTLIRDTVRRLAQAQHIDAQETIDFLDGLLVQFGNPSEQADLVRA